MGKRRLAVAVVIVLAVAVALFYLMSDEEVLGDDVEVASEPVLPEVIDFEKYNYDFVDEEVKGILSSMIGGGRTAFYLPPTGYVNVSRGNKFGVAFALNNPNPSGDNMFEFEWVVDDSVVENCGVDVDVAQAWIERGWRSWGKVPKGWVDHMTVYFSFPADIEPCNVKYNFEIRRDGIVYDTKVLEFNLV